MRLPRSTCALALAAGLPACMSDAPIPSSATEAETGPPLAPMSCADRNPLNLGGNNTLNQWPESPSWQFVAVGRGHGDEVWVPFLQALHRVDPDMAVNIEHEDTELDQIEGLRLAAENLIAAAGKAEV